MKKKFYFLIGIGIVILILGWYFFNKLIPVELLFVGGPGGCKGADCEEFCQNNHEECMKWCEENPEICEKFIGGGFPELDFFETNVEPPDIVINYAKTVNLNSGAFTKEDIIKAKELGANLISIWPPRIINNDEIIFFPKRDVGMINFAHKNGLQVELRSSFAGGIVNDYEKFKTNALEHAVEYAKFAEKYKVYRIVPFGEIDNNMLNKCNKISELAEELLKEMRKYYSGQIGVGVVGSWRDCGYSFKGYDYLTLSAYPQAQIGIDKWLTPNPNASRIIENNNLALMINWARGVADRSNIKILHIGETGVINPDDDKREDAPSFSIGSKEKEAEFYESLFEQASDKVEGISVFYNSLNNYFSVNGDSAEQVVKKWFGKLK